MPGRRVVAFASAAELGPALAHLIASRAEKALGSGAGTFSLGLSGGSLVSILSKELPAVTNLDCSRWLVGFCDERLVPFDDAESTYGLYKVNNKWSVVISVKVKVNTQEGRVSSGQPLFTVQLGSSWCVRCLAQGAIYEAASECSALKVDVLEAAKMGKCKNLSDFDMDQIVMVSTYQYWSKEGYPVKQGSSDRIMNIQQPQGMRARLSGLILPQITVRDLNQLFPKISIPDDRVLPIDPSLPVQECAKDYASKLSKAFATEQTPVFDMLLLGMGPDGHTCSLFPDHPLLQEKQKTVAPISDSPKPPPQRVTLTLPVVNAARCVVFVSTGGSKAPVLKQVLEGGDGPVLPAALVTPTQGELFWLVDEPAAASLTLDVERPGPGAKL